MHLRILGESVITLRDRDYTPGAPQFFALLLRLAADSDLSFQRQVLSSLVFRDAPNDAAATHSIRQMIYTAIKRGAPLSTTARSVKLRSKDLTTDIDALLNDDVLLSSPRQRNLTILSGYSPSISPDFDEWVEAFRGQQEARLRHFLVRSLVSLKTKGEWSAVEARARECLALDPLNEPATLALAESLARTGSKERALALLDRYQAEVGRNDANITLPAALLRKRIDGLTQKTRSAQPLAPLKGRGALLASLHEQWLRSRSGQTQCTLLRGEAGVGKSRLIDEFAGNLSLVGSTTAIRVRHAGTERSRPFAFFADLAPRLLSMPGGAGCDPRLSPFRNRLTDGLLHDTDVVSAGESAFVRSGVQRAIIDMLDCIATETPLVLLVDDSRALDDVSLQFIATLSRTAPSLRAYIIIAQDISDTREPITQFAGNTLTVKPLSDVDARDVLMSLVPNTSPSLAEDTVVWCIGVAAGNPAFLHLLARHVSTSIDQRDIPSDILSAVDQRLTTLPSVSARIIEACAVLGNHCDPVTLEAVLAMPPLSLLDALHDLEDSGFIEYVNDRIVLRSTLVADRIVHSAGRAVLGVLHARSALVLERLDDRTNSSWRIASHWRFAGQHDRARATLAASWQKSVQLGQPASAENSIHEHLALATDASDRLSLYDDLIEVTQAKGDSRATIRAIDERAALVASSGLFDQRRETLAFDRLEALLQDHADPSLPERELLKFMRTESLDSVRRVRAAQRLLASADATANVTLANQVRDGLSAIRIVDSSAKAYHDQSLLIYHSVFGDKSCALELAHEIIASARRETHSWPHLRGMVNASLALGMASDVKEALNHLEECYSHVSGIGAASFCILVASRLASFCIDDGDISEANQWASRAKGFVDLGVDGRLPSDYLSAQADLAIISGDFSTAADLISTMRNDSPLYDAPRYRMELLSYSMRLSQYQQLAVQAEEVEELLDWHRRARSLGRHDDDMDALWVALNRQGRSELASALLAEYLSTHRREVRVAGYFLRARSASDVAWSLSATHGSVAKRG